MGSDSKVYIAGIGYTPAPSQGSAKDDIVSSRVSAATKAFLDAGVTYDNISKGVRTKRSESASAGFQAFDKDFDSIEDVQSGSELDASVRLVKEEGAQCVLVTIAEKSGTVAIVLVSERFLKSHPYLKSSSALIKASKASDSTPDAKSLHELCKLVWSLRGWSDSSSAGKKETKSFQAGSSSKHYELSRADGAETPKWKDVEHKQDGKHRLRYNPAKETKEVSFEDFEAVRAISKSSQDKKSKVLFKPMGGDRAALAKL